MRLFPRKELIIGSNNEQIDGVDICTRMGASPREKACVRPCSPLFRAGSGDGFTDVDSGGRLPVLPHSRPLAVFTEEMTEVHHFTTGGE